jgi:hypothetical protein
MRIVGNLMGELCDGRLDAASALGVCAVWQSGGFGRERQDRCV